MSCYERKPLSVTVFRPRGDLLARMGGEGGASPARALISLYQKATYDRVGCIQATCIEEAFNPGVPLDGGKRCRIGDVFAFGAESYACIPAGFLPIPGLHERLSLVDALSAPVTLKDLI